MKTDHTQENPVMQGDLVLAQVNLAANIRAMTIHQRIKELREKKELSMEALAALVGVAYQTVQQWESGKTAPQRKRLASVADALNTTPEYLQFGTSVGPTEEQTSFVASPESSTSLLPLRYSVATRNFRRVFVVGRGQGGLAERLWTDGDYPVGATDEYAELATTDPHAFLTPIVGTSMVPKFNPGDFVFVEPGTPPEAGDDVLVRLVTGQTLIKVLRSTRNGIMELHSYNHLEQGPLFFKVEEISWMYYIAHYVQARKIKTRM
jgi:phage repressor protein C with HTH and peptisase S24 domain